MSESCHQCRRRGEQYGWPHDFDGICLEGCGSDECIWYGEPNPELLPYDERHRVEGCD